MSGGTIGYQGRDSYNDFGGTSSVTSNPFFDNSDWVVNFGDGNSVDQADTENKNSLLVYGIVIVGVLLAIKMLKQKKKKG